MENVKNSMAKNKKIKHVLCYFALVVLVALLFLPMIFRITFKEDETKKDEVVQILNCTKNGETIRSTFLNDTPQNVMYTLPCTVENSEDETEEKSETKTEEVIDDSNPVLKKLSIYSKALCDAETSIATVKFSASMAEGSMDYEQIFNKIDNQQKYYGSNGFSCTVETTTYSH